MPPLWAPRAEGALGARWSSGGKVFGEEFADVNPVAAMTLAAPARPVFLEGGCPAFRETRASLWGDSVPGLGLPVSF